MTQPTSGSPSPERPLLIVGGQSDPNIARLVDQAHLRSLDYFFWNTDNAFARRIGWNYQSPSLDLDDRTICPSAVFIRHNVFNVQTQYDSSVYDTIISFALCWPEVIVPNRPVLTSTNNKAQNLRHAEQFGFQVPRTIVLADATALMDHPNPGQHIAKPLMGGGLACSVEQLTTGPDSLASAPPLFIQERLAGENLRVYVLGAKAIGFHLASQQLDYREDPQVDVRLHPLDASLANRCIKFANSLGFDFCAIDFRCRHGLNEPVFLEINSSPMFVRFDDACENQLADGLLELLS